MHPNQVLRITHIVAVVFLALQTAIASPLQQSFGTTEFVPAVYDQGSDKLWVYPLDGKQSFTVSLSAGLKQEGLFTGIAFSSDGKSFYGESVIPAADTAILKIDISPAKKSVVPGSAGLGHVRCFHALTQSPLIQVYAWSFNERKAGTLQIDPVTATHTFLSDDEPSICGKRGQSGRGGLLSPDGKRVLRQDGRALHIVELGKGVDRVVNKMRLEDSCVLSPNRTRITCYGQMKTQQIEALKAKAATTFPTTVREDRLPCLWSPDARWFICDPGEASHDKKLLLFDSNDPSRPRTLPIESRERPVWSPDSTRLLFFKACLLSEAYKLETVEVPSGAKSDVKSCGCELSGGGETIGWVDRRSVSH